MKTKFFTNARRNSMRKFELIVTFAFLFSLICSVPAATVQAQADQPADQPPAPLEENLPDLNSLTNHLHLPFVTSPMVDSVPAEVRGSDSVDDISALATNIVACNARDGWKYVAPWQWSAGAWNSVVSGCPNIYVNPSVSGFVQVYYYSRSQGRWIYKPYRWVNAGAWTEMGTNFSAGTNWYARIFNYSSSGRWLNVKMTSGRLINSTPPSTGNQNDLLSHNTALNLLRNGGITQIISSGGCSDKNRSNCTSLDGIRRGSIQGLIDFKKKCDRVKGSCDIHITGGTETGHSGGTYSHGTGYKIDFRWSFGGGDNYAGQYIKSNFNRTYTRGSWGEAYEDPATGYLYVLHGPALHWDVCFSRSC